MQVVVDDSPQGGVVLEASHYAETVCHGLQSLEGEDYPSSHHACSHGRDRAVYRIEEAHAIVVHAVDKLQTAYRELVQPHVSVFLYASEGCYVAQVGVLCHHQIFDDGSRSDDAIVQFVHTESLEAIDLEVPCEAFHGCRLGEYPVVKLEGDVPVAEGCLELFLFAALVEYFLRHETVDEFLRFVYSSLGQQEFAGRYVEEGDAAKVGLGEMYGGEEIVFLIVEHIVINRDTGCDKLCDAAFDQFLCQFGVFELVADCDPLAGTYEFGEIGVEGVVREACHLDGFALAVAAPCECYPEDFGRGDGVRRIGLIEVAASEKQHCIGMFGLEVKILLHHWCHHDVVCHIAFFQVLAMFVPTKIANED